MNTRAQEIDSFLDTYTGSLEGYPSILKKAMRYAVLEGGKRFRAFLILEIGKLFSLESSLLLPLAAAVEIIHAYSLVHDDLPSLDNATLRRHKPACHIAFSESIALLVGDALIPLAFQLIADLNTCLPEQRCLITYSLAQAIGGGGMVGGQVLDISPFPVHTDEGFLEKVQRLKTGALIEFCVLMPAKLASCPLMEQQALESYSAALGIVFQIADDLLDEKKSWKTGKNTQHDQSAHKVTWLTLLGHEGACQALMNYYQQGLKALRIFDHQFPFLEQILHFAAYRNH